MGVENLDSDASLYDSGFFTAKEKKDIQWFHQAPDNEKADRVTQFKSSRVRQMALRILARNGMPGGERQGHGYGQHLAAVVGISTGAIDQPMDVKGYKNESKLNKDQFLHLQNNLLQAY